MVQKCNFKRIMFRHITSGQFAKNISRFHTCICLNGESKVMRKLMGMSARKKKNRYIETPPLLNPNTFNHGALDGKKSMNSRRATVLNKLFMRHITDLMTSGESASDYAGYGIEINRVQVTSDYKIVQVFWLAKGSAGDNVVVKILQQKSGELRHELTQLRVIGMVPVIKFVKDKHFAQLMEVDVRLANTDFGEDYVPLEPSVKLKSQLQINTKLEPYIKEQIKKLDSTMCNEEVEELDQTIPPMTRNVLGLNHSEIMGKIQKLRKKSQALHRFDNAPDQTEAPRSYNSSPIEYSTESAKREAFKQFLTERQILRNKAHKIEKNYRLESDYLEEEWDNMKRQYLDSFNFDNFCKDNDFVEDDDAIK